MNRLTKMLGGLLLAGLVAACGGGGGSAGSTPGGGGGPVDPGPGGDTPTIASMIYQLSKPTIQNSGTDASLLTVTALDANNNPVSGAALSVSVDTGVYTPISGTTDANGQASGNISIGANKSNRDITAALRLGDLTATAVVAVTGAQITLTPVPATPAPGATTRVDIRVLDVNGTGVPNVPVQLSGTLGLTGTVQTDAGGNAAATLGAAPTTAGSYTVEASALGVQASRTVQVIGGGGTTIPDAVGNISSASLAIVPNLIAPNTTGSTVNRAELRAKFLNNLNQAIQNVRVRFEIVDPGLGSGEQLTTADAVVYSDVNGEALSSYIAGTRSSPTDGVVIRACYGANDAAIANGACPNSVTDTMTVASQPLSITLGDNNLLARGNGQLTYIKQFDIAVADAAGNAVPDALVSATVDITRYSKGLFSTEDEPEPQVSCLNEDFNRNGFLDTSLNEDANGNGVLDPGEDLNGNGQLDLVLNEDVNRNNKLDPRKADVLLSFVGSNRTGANGRMTIQVEYPQNVATWLRYTVRVTTNVAGSEGTDTKSYITSYIEGDDTNGSFLVAPYGSALDCSSPN